MRRFFRSRTMLLSSSPAFTTAAIRGSGNHPPDTQPLNWCVHDPLPLRDPWAAACFLSMLYSAAKERGRQRSTVTAEKLRMKSSAQSDLPVHPAPDLIGERTLPQRKRCGPDCGTTDANAHRIGANPE
jgi:hypothetical protein